MSTDTRSLFLRMPRLGALWWAVLAFWIFLGFLIANQIFWGMKSHDHSWWRLFLWQAGACAIWALLVPLVFSLARRFPLEWRAKPFLVHVSAAVVLGAIHLVPVTLLALLLDPYLPVSEASSFADEYVFMMLHWFGQDVIIYVALLGLAALVDSRERQKNRRLRESVLQAELAQAELRALRLELQPHFIFNALNAIVGLLRSEDSRSAEKMVIGLSELLRCTLDGRGRQRVPLVEELRLVQLYLDIQQIRFGGRLEIELRVEPGTETTLVPSLLLQPLVENAIRHGVERRAGTGRIGVYSHREGDHLVLRVLDNGPGPTSSDGPRGIGLDNVSARLDALYGDNWSLDLRQGTEGGAEVYVELPWEAEPADPDQDLVALEPSSEPAAGPSESPAAKVDTLPAGRTAS